MAELGCGLGVVGVAAAAFGGARSVELLDLEKLAVWYAIETAALNGLLVSPDAPAEDTDTPVEGRENKTKGRVWGHVYDW